MSLLAGWVDARMAGSMPTRELALPFSRSPGANNTCAISQAIGGAPDALRMQRVVSFYEKLPRGASPEVQAKGLLGRYQAKYFGKNASVKRTTPLPFALKVAARHIDFI